MYKKLSGMTGTAKTEEEEFRNIYNMIVVEIPTNEPIIRDDANDLIFATMKAKYNAIANEIRERNALGQPILVGTISIETSELLSSLLKRKGVKHDVLNAKQHEREAEIVEKAGKQFSVTIATNMAGRGTDIKLGEGVVELGGLAVIGTERHESRRIDNQLRGRSGRQGDPGYSRFFLSAEDELMQRFGGERFQNQINMLTKTRDSKDESPIEYGIFSRMVERAQKQIEGNNFDRRKTVLQYDEVLRKQREVIYGQRRDILFEESITDIAKGMVERTLDRVAATYTVEGNPGQVDKNELFKQLNGRYFNLNLVSKSELDKSPQEVSDYLINLAMNDIDKKVEKFTDEKFNDFLKAITLKVVDNYWIRHIDQMSELRQGIVLQSYAQMNPLREYQETGFQMFTDMITNIEEDVTKYVLRAIVRENMQRVQVAKPVSTYSGKEEQTKRKPRTASKVGRNDPCPCGSGKKYKQCHGR